MEIFGLIIPVGAIGAITGAFGSWLQSLAMKKRLFQGEAVLLAQLRNDWISLQADWHKALLIALGPKGHYSPAPPLEKKKFISFLAQMEAINPKDPRHNPAERETKKEKLRNASHEYEQASRKVGMFLAGLAHLVLSGRLTASQAYSLVGPDLTIRSKQIRVILGAKEPEWASQEIARELRRLSSWAAALPGTTERILALIDILWAESCRLGDAQPWYFIRASSVKFEHKSGEASRKIVSVHAIRAGGALAAIRLSRHLLWSEFLPSRYSQEKIDPRYKYAKMRGGFPSLFKMNYTWIVVFLRSLRSV